MQRLLAVRNSDAEYLHAGGIISATHLKHFGFSRPGYNVAPAINIICLKVGNCLAGVIFQPVPVIPRKLLNYFLKCVIILDID